VNINEILEMQLELDKSSGFPVTFASTTERYGQLTKDLVGLVGEIGEFCNVVKKINIKLDRPDEYELNVDAAEAALRQELADTFIYILRISAMLQCDLEEETVEKIRINSARYAKLRAR
jgi:NTP pyrophosphatase (non-canonical NTP hydrolase)